MKRRNCSCSFPNVKEKCIQLNPSHTDRNIGKKGTWQAALLRGLLSEKDDIRYNKRVKEVVPMKIVVFEEEADILKETCDLLKKNLRADDTVEGFSTREKVVEYVEEYITDTAFICFHDTSNTGLHLVEDLRKANPKMNIIFISDSNLYMHEAFEMRTSGFLRRPVTGEDFRREMQNLRFHIEEFRKSRG